MAFDPLDPSLTEALRAWHVQHDAGIGAADALRTSAKVCSSTGARACFEAAAQAVDCGEPPERMLEALAPILSAGERAVLAAGWKSGRVDAVMEGVLKNRELWAQTRREIRARLALPAVVLLGASIIAPIPALIAGGTLSAYAISALAPLLLAAILYLAVSSALHAQARRGIASPSVLDRVLLNLPLAGRLERLRNQSLCASLLAQLLDAGVLLSQALELCARVLPNGVYREELARLATHVRKGEPLGTALRANGLWRDEFSTLVHTGEAAGRLDENLRRHGVQLREQYAFEIGQFAAWLPRLIYALVVAFILLNLLRLFGVVAGLYQQLAP